MNKFITVLQRADEAFTNRLNSGDTSYRTMGAFLADWRTQSVYAGLNLLVAGMAIIHLCLSIYLADIFFGEGVYDGHPVYRTIFILLIGFGGLTLPYGALRDFGLKTIVGRLVFLLLFASELVAYIALTS